MPRNDCDSTISDGAAGACHVDGGVRHDGCIYPDEVIMDKGVAFNVRYTGCVEVKTSMKSLDFSTRTQVARECINRVCESAGLKSITKRRIDKKILQFISDRPCMQNAGTNVIINVSSRALSLINEETGEIIATHNMPHISFASGGDSDTLDFLGYIAKNKDEWRACYVLECIDGQSEDLILTIGKAFMLSPEVVIALLRDKYLNRMVNRKLSCRLCMTKRNNSMLVFNYHSKSSLALHRLWKHGAKNSKVGGNSHKQKQRIFKVMKKK